MEHLHQVSLRGVGFGSPVPRPAPERLPGLEVSFLLLFLKLPRPHVVVAFLVDLQSDQLCGVSEESPH